jgi:hypothetical protein
MPVLQAKKAVSQERITVTDSALDVCAEGIRAGPTVKEGHAVASRKGGLDKVPAQKTSSA